jgi:hypothetical protein
LLYNFLVVFRQEKSDKRRNSGIVFLDEHFCFEANIPKCFAKTYNESAACWDATQPKHIIFFKIAFSIPLAKEKG